MNQSNSIGALAAALAAAQAAFPPIPKNKTARVPTKTGGSYSYNYADLADILDATRPALTANGLALIQPVAAKGAEVTIRTRLLHASGEWLEEELSIRAVDDRPQSLGAACTYGRRYAAGGLLGIAPDDDVDGEVQDVETRRREPAPRPPAPRPITPSPAPAAGPLAPGVDPASMAPAPLPAARKADPAVLTAVERLLKTTSLTRAGFGATATRVLGRPVKSAADLQLVEVEKIAAVVLEEETKRSSAPNEGWQEDAA